VWIGLNTGSRGIEPSQFLFSLTSSIFGAAIAPILFLFYLELGVTMRKAIAWTLVSSFATYVWAISNSTFDNAQHAFFVFGAIFFAYLSAQRKSYTLAAVGGLFAGTVFLYQEYFILIMPALALATLNFPHAEKMALPESTAPEASVLGRMASEIKRIFRSLWSMACSAWNSPGDARSSLIRYGLFLTTMSLGVVLFLMYNEARFGSWFDDGRLRSYAPPFRHQPVLGNPLAGFLTLLVSPGKSVFLYSPPLLLGIFGMSRLWRRKTGLSASIAAASLILVLFLSCIAFVGGDWCWGPRYLTSLLPLWALAFPFMNGSSGVRKYAVPAIIVAGFLVQVLALSVENQRFFFEKSFNDFFWAEDPWVYFKHSALFTRFGEAFSLRNGLPPTARLFNSIPIPEWTTYSLLGPPPNIPRNLVPLWIRNFKIFFLPRPWPLWMSSLSPASPPINVGAWVKGLLGMTVLGCGLVYRGFRSNKYR